MCAHRSVRVALDVLLVNILRDCCSRRCCFEDQKQIHEVPVADERIVREEVIGEGLYSGLPGCAVLKHTTGMLVEYGLIQRLLESACGFSAQPATHARFYRDSAPIAHELDDVECDVRDGAEAQIYR